MGARVRESSLIALEDDLAEVRRIVLSRLNGRARVYLYGSCARNQATRTSDIDVGIIPLEPLDPAQLGDIREALEQSNVLLPVDLVNLAEADAEFREHVLRDAVKWSD